MSTQPAREDEVALRILHSADWHLGLEFPAFDEADRPKLSRARLEAVEQLFDQADSYQVHAVLCSGDLFDEPNPADIWWKPLLELLQKRSTPERPIVLLPGNHDPLTEGSVYSASHPFRQKLPAGVHVVDRADFSLELGPEAVLYAVPCTSRAGAIDPTTHLPPRAAGDRRIRLGMAHGQTIDIEGFQTNFPINPDRAAQLGLDYLALGDTHGFRKVREGEHPVVYPGSPEATRFGEEGTGFAVLAYFRRSGSPPTIKELPIGKWRWRDEVCRDLGSLDRLLRDVDANTVVRLKLELQATLSELDRVEAQLAELKGNSAVHGKAGVARIERAGLVRGASSGTDFPEDMPQVLKAALAALSRHSDADLAQRAIYHLYRLVKPCS